MASEWTLERELNDLASLDHTEESLRALGLLGQDEVFESIRILDEWYRSGAETYSLRFAITTGSSSEYQYFMKACIAYDGGSPLATIFSEWLSRRNVIGSTGIHTPTLHAVGAALLVEEYIPHHLIELLGATTNRASLLHAIGQTAARLLNAGFVPISAHDWRSRGDDVVLVDFGQDLGPAGMSQGVESGLLSEILDAISRAGIELRPFELQRVSVAYEETLQ